MRGNEATPARVIDEYGMLVESVVVKVGKLADAPRVDTYVA